MHLDQEKLIDIAGEMDIGMICFVHRDTGELISYPRDLEDGDYFEGEDNLWLPDIEKVSADPDSYIEIGPMPASESFKVMEDFADSVKDYSIQEPLIRVLSNKKPFAHFKALVHQLPERHKNAWFAFKEQKMTEWIKAQLDS